MCCQTLKGLVADHLHVFNPSMDISLYCRPGNFRVFKFSRITDFGNYHVV